MVAKVLKMYFVTTYQIIEIDTPIPHMFQTI